LNETQTRTQTQATCEHNYQPDILINYKQLFMCTKCEHVMTQNISRGWGTYSISAKAGDAPRLSVRSRLAQAEKA